MAATPFPPPLNGSAYMFDIYNDGATVRTSPTPNPNLPSGPCNFVDLAHGVNSAKCGCRRFWTRQVAGVGNYTADQMGWCMCSHHACFHDDVQATSPQTTQTMSRATAAAPVVMMDPVPGQENEKPRTNREPLSPVQDLASFGMPSSLGGAAMDFATLNFESFATNMVAGANMPQADLAVQALETDSMPDTLSWRNCVSTQGGITTLPPIPSQCLMPSQTASTAASSQMRYLKPFGGTGLDTLSGVSSNKAQDTSIERNMDNKRGTDVAPGATRDGQTPKDAIPISSGAATPTAPLSHTNGSRPTSLSPFNPHREAIQNLSELVDGHEHRLDKLENASIDGAAHEGCEDRIDHVDVKIYELESRMDDVERKMNDDNTSVASSRQLLQRDDDATNSVASGSTNATTRPTDRSDIYAQLHALQSRVNQLEASSLPSYNSPWELEVVFLPFALRGVWLEAQDFPTQRQSGGWTQQPNTNSRATPDPQSFSHGEWMGADSDWLLPRACVPGRMIDQRLRSRGLIKTISVRGCDARSVQIAVGNAFEGTLRSMPITPGPYSHRSPYAADARVGKYLGLQQDWVPLRKVHKDSRLRFLSAAEMITPVLWDVAFLMNSVIMKATGMHRLYITQPEAYLQDHRLLGFRGSNSGWTWQKLRELNRVYPESQSSGDSADVPEADALEEYWTWNDRLDELPSARSSAVSLQQSHDKLLNQSRTSDGSTELFFTGPSNQVMSRSPTMLRGHSPLIQMMDCSGSRPPTLRTGSMPPVAPPAVSSPGGGKRRGASYTLANNGSQNYQRHSSPLVTGRPSPRLSVSHSPAVAMITKHRRQATRSPSLRQHNTPRWSNRSYSRSPSVMPYGFNVAYVEDNRNDRRTMQFAYATPSSNAPVEYPPPLRHNSRSINVYEGDEMDFDDEDRGSSTDAYDDSEPEPEDPDIDIDVYEDQADMLDDLIDPRHGQQVVQQFPQRGSQDAQQVNGPEDEPWPGIEDDMPDGEIADPGSDVSSQPSEYPSTQRAWHLTDDRETTEQVDDRGIGFKIHVDEGDASVPGAVERWS